MITLKKGQSFSIYGRAVDRASEGLSLDGYTLSSLLKSDTDELQLDVVITNSINGEFRLDGILGAMAAGEYKFDVKFEKGYVIDFSQTEKLKIEGSVTQ
jgi:hypothetical protein